MLWVVAFFVDTLTLFFVSHEQEHLVLVHSGRVGHGGAKTSGSNNDNLLSFVSLQHWHNRPQGGPLTPLENLGGSRGGMTESFSITETKNISCKPNTRGKGDCGTDQGPIKVGGSRHSQLRWMKEEEGTKTTNGKDIPVRENYDDTEK
jgi:hypothetical protein